MQKFLQKFDEQFKGKQYLEIEFCTDNPLTKKFVRYNQGGDACHCIEGQATASQKTKNGWQPVECSEQCQHRQKNEQGKSACNRIAWLKFFIPSVCQDRIWLMKITGQTSINRIDAFINVQKLLGNSLNDRYILFLKQEEQTSKATGQTFNNYVLDILKKEDFILSNEIPQNTENKEQLSTNNTQNVNNNVVKQEKNEATKKATTTNVEKQENLPKETKTNTQIQETKPKETTKKTTKTKTKKAEEQKTETQPEQNEFANHYILDSTFSEKIANKKGELKEYIIGKFYDMNDAPCEIVIKPEYSKELQECEFGTLVKLDIKDVAGRKFAMELEFVNKLTKKVAA